MDQGIIGRSYGPVRAVADQASVESFVAATGDDFERWSDAVPPLFANALLFRAAPLFLEDPDVAPLTASLIHAEQEYHWAGPLTVGSVLDVRGEVEAVRTRGALNLVTFTVSAGDWLRGSSVFALSDRAAAAADEVAEPAATHKPATDPAPPLPLPDAGAELPSMRCAASRADLVRYAAATGDFNPIHWDHDSAVAAGLGGIVVHGLLMAAWLGKAAARHAPGPNPLASLNVRFRKPLPPGTGAVVVGRVGEVDHDGADLDLTLEAAGEKLVSAAARVTR